MTVKMNYATMDKAANAIATNCYLKIHEITKPDD